MYIAQWPQADSDGEGFWVHYSLGATCNETLAPHDHMGAEWSHSKIYHFECFNIKISFFFVFFKEIYKYL